MTKKRVVLIIAVLSITANLVLTGNWFLTGIKKRYIEIGASSVLQQIVSEARRGVDISIQVEGGLVTLTPTFTPTAVSQTPTTLDIDAPDVNVGLDK